MYFNWVLFKYSNPQLINKYFKITWVLLQKITLYFPLLLSLNFDSKIFIFTENVCFNSIIYKKPTSESELLTTLVWSEIECVCVGRCQMKLKKGLRRPFLLQYCQLCVCNLRHTGCSKLKSTYSQWKVMACWHKEIYFMEEELKSSCVCVWVNWKEGSAVVVAAL